MAEKKVKTDETIDKKTKKKVASTKKSEKKVVKATSEKKKATKAKKTTETKKSTSSSQSVHIDISSEIKEKSGDTFTLTKRGLEILKSELKELKTVRRAEISERIRQARALGDLSENSEYEDAKREQAVVEARISELENMLRKSKIIDEDSDQGDNESVRMGHTVVIESIETKEKSKYRIVSVLEADPFSNCISNISPLGSALIGHKVGNVIRVVLPAGAVRYRLIEIVSKES